MASTFAACHLLAGGTAHAQTTSPPGAEPSTVADGASPATPAVSCSTADLRHVVTAPPTQTLQVVRPTRLIAENIEGTLMVRAPSTAGSSGNLKLRLFVGPWDIRRVTPERAVEFEELDYVTTHGVTAAQAAALDIAEPAAWHEARFSGPHSSRPWHMTLSEKKGLVILACSVADDRPLALRVMVISISRFWQTFALALAFVTGLYLLTATAVWRMRKRLARQRVPPPPQRWEAVEALAWRRCLDPVVVTADTFDNGSLPKLQVLVFTLLVLFGMALIALRTGVLSELSPTVAFLLGIPAVGAIGSQLTTRVRDRLSSANWAWLVQRGVLPVNDPGADAPRWRDLVMGGSELDIYKVQAAAFSLVVAIAMIQSGFTNLGAFAVPETMLQVLALSQVVMVGGRFTRPRTIGEIDELITELKARDGILRTAAKSGIDVDAKGVALTTTAATGAPFATLSAAAAQAAVPQAVARYEEVAKEVAILLESLTHRKFDPKPLMDPLVQAAIRP